MHVCVYVHTHVIYMWLPRWRSAKESACQCRRCKRRGFDPWVGRSLGIGNNNPSSILAWKIPLTEKPGGLQSMGLQRVRHDWARTHAQLIKSLFTALVSVCVLCGYLSILLVFGERAVLFNRNIIWSTYYLKYFSGHTHTHLVQYI